MKKLILFTTLFLFAAISMAQTFEISPDEWSSATDTSAFDGVSRAALVVGTSSMRNVGSPIISVNRTDGEKTRILLCYLPATLCKNTVVDIKFDEESIYTVEGRYSLQTERYTLIFTSKMTVDTFINKLKTCKELHVRLINRCDLFVTIDFTLNGASEALAVIQ